MNLETSDPYLEDFSELGGPDFITIPWPYFGKIPILSGISENSNYYKSLRVTANGNKFNEGELLKTLIINFIIQIMNKLYDLIQIFLS